MGPPEAPQGGLNGVAPRSRQQNILSLCSGTGALDLGIHDALADLGFTPRTVLHLEREITAAGILAAKMEEGLLDDCPVWSDLESFDGEPWFGLVDGIIGGVPCQPHSNAGKRGGITDERWLWPSVARILDETGTWWFLLENVDGLRTSNGGEALGKILQGLASRGFVFAWIVLPASAVGAPHRRKRIFLLAIKGDHLEHAKGAGQPAKPLLLLRPQPEEGPGKRQGHGDDALDTGRDVADTFRDAGEVSQAIREDRTQRTSPPRRSRTADGVGHAADAISPGLEGRAGEPGDDGTQRKTAQRESRSLADPDEVDDDRRGPRGPRGRDEPPDSSPRIRPQWPPGPKDLEAWNEVLAIWPNLAPALPASKPDVRGVADGDALGLHGNCLPRDDRLRASGNAVVRQQAEEAFTILWRHLT